MRDSPSREPQSPFADEVRGGLGGPINNVGHGPSDTVKNAFEAEVDRRPALDLEQYRALVERVPTMVWRGDADAKCDYVNATWLAFTGRSLEEELGDGWTEGVHPNDVMHCLERSREHVARRESFEIEYRLRRHDGAYRYILHRAAPYDGDDGQFEGFIASAVEVDDYRSRLAAAGGAEFFEMSLDHLCIAGFDGYFKRLNPSWTKTLGWTAEELMARPSADFVHPEDRRETLRRRSELKTGIPLFALANRYLCKDGTYRWFEWKSVAHVESGLVYAVARDVTQQKESQRALQEVTESLAATLNSVADGVIVTEGDGGIVRMNRVAETLTGWTLAEAKGRQIEEVFHIVNAETRIPAALPGERTLREGISMSVAIHTLLVGRDGKDLPIASSCAPLREASGGVMGTVLIFRDMTAEILAKEVQTRLQSQLVFADRMASVGTLAAGVAHEINNPLAYVIGNLDVLIEEIRVRREGPPTSQTAEWVEMALEAREGSERIRKIVRGLKTFSRAEEERRAVIDVRPVLDLAINMAFNEIRHRARLVKDYGDIPLVEADDAHLGQVFINLLVNAAQALSEGGSETNEIRIVTSTDPAGRAVIEIRDTGPGIPASVIGRVFDPFFTTKPIGIGTGLGLYICHNIVTSVGGTITAANREGRGTIFRVVLPASAGRLGGASSGLVARAPSTSRRADVLVVDDDNGVATALRRILRDHDVTVASTAREALALIALHGPFDVVLSDLMMPEMSGMDLHEELRQRSPDLADRMVFISGGAFTPAATAFLDRVPNERLDKPIDAAVVRALVGAWMGAGHPGRSSA